MQYTVSIATGRKTNMASIVILESDRNIAAKLYAELSACYNVYICEESGMLLSCMQQYRPDLVVVDLSFAGEDGIGLLKMAYAAGIRPAVVVSARYYSDYVEEQMQQFETAFYFRRPIAAKEMLPRIVDIMLGLGNIDPMDIRRLANEFLLRLGFDMSRHGYTHVVESIFYQAQHMDCMFTNELYPSVAKAFGGNGKQVERIVRANISDAQTRGNQDVWRLYFPVDKHGQVIHLTTGAFLKRIAYAINDYYDQFKNRTSDKAKCV